MQRSFVQKLAEAYLGLGHVTFVGRPLYFHGYGQGWK
jgi:hypothetical protein